MTTKIYKRRDSATAALRKLGVKKQNYKDFIEPSDGGFICHLQDAKASLAKPAVKQKPKKQPTKTPRITISSRARELVLEGLTNEEVWIKLQPEFNLSDSKKWYPAWYRCEQRRKGHLAPQHYFDSNDPIIKLED